MLKLLSGRKIRTKKTWIENGEEGKLLPIYIRKEMEAQKNLARHEPKGACTKACSRILDTPLGSMIAIGNEEALYLLEFINYRSLDREIERLKQKANFAVAPGDTRPIRSIENELILYFKGELEFFKTPICLMGTPFQKRVWTELMNIPFGETRSYSDIATSIGKPTAFRAVAQANGANKFPLIIPCHRVINANGALGGYSSGLTRKESLLLHEKKYAPALCVR